MTGQTYDEYLVVDRQGRAVPRPENEPWQRAIRRYLTSGCALVVARQDETGLSPATLRELAELPVLARAGEYTVRAQPSGCSARTSAQSAASCAALVGACSLSGPASAGPDRCRPGADGRSCSPDR